MNSRERMLAAINRQPLDRVPLDIWATGEVRAKLRKHFGGDDDHAWQAALHIDGIPWAGPTYTGPRLPADGLADIWGVRRRRIAYATGHYDEMELNPLAAARTIDDLEAYSWPSADWYDYSTVRPQAAALHGRHAVQCGYMAPFTFHMYLRGLENALTDPLLEPEFTRHLLMRMDEFFYEHHRRCFEAGAGLIDVTQIVDDYGMQTGPIMGLDTFRRFYKPYVKKYIDLAHSFGIKAFHHDDGAMRDFLPDLVEMGIDILNPIQWVCPGMEQEGLKRDFGGRLCFHGGIDNQRILPFGSPAEVRAEVRHNIDTLAADKTGYILAPCHNLQAVTPIENILAMYDEAWNYGTFSPPSRPI